MRVTNVVPLGFAQLLPVGTVNHVETLKDSCAVPCAKGRIVRRIAKALRAVLSVLVTIVLLAAKAKVAASNVMVISVRPIASAYDVVSHARRARLCDRNLRWGLCSSAFLEQ
jgi:rhodanese-related sulfurtransferase